MINPALGKESGFVPVVVKCMVAILAQRDDLGIVRLLPHAPDHASQKVMRLILIPHAGVAEAQGARKLPDPCEIARVLLPLRAGLVRPGVGQKGGVSEHG